jgi:small subunit ribosomal protein S6
MDEEKSEEVTGKIKALIESNGGEVVKFDKWGKRRLAHEIKDLKEGYYIILQMNADASVVREVDRVMKITDEVLRHLIVRQDG